MKDNYKALGSRHAQHSFAQVPNMNTPRSQFNRSFNVKDTMDFDELTPVFIDEILPGDTCNLNTQVFARLATQTVPVMDNMYIDFFFFFVPNRLTWSNWQKFCGEQEDPGDSTDYLIPTITGPGSGGFTVGDIYDKFGLPTGVNSLEINALPLRAYNLIYNEWFRDQNLQDSVTVNKGDGPDPNTDYALLKRGKRHDYFTSCLPWPQKGDAVSLPLGTSAPIESNGQPLTVEDSTNGQDRILGAASGAIDVTMSSSFTNPGRNDLYYVDGLQADLSTATAATINELRNAFMVQELLELDARGGTRYTEILKAHFNVTSPDQRLQRPEFLAGGQISIIQHPIPQTSESNTTLQANLAAYSTGSTSNNSIGFTKSFVEHGYVIGLAAARADITYQQGVNKLWSRSDRYDFFWPKLQELGEQAVLNKEIYAQGTSADDDVFGYQERFAEYRYKPSEIRGQFRSTFAQTLDVWHLGEQFSSLPALNSTFIESTTPIERSLATATSYPHLLMDMFFNYKQARPMMVHGVPASLGRF